MTTERFEQPHDDIFDDDGNRLTPATFDDMRRRLGTYDDDAVTSDALVAMTVAASRGDTFETAPVPHDDRHRDTWDRIVTDLADMAARGIGVEVPAEIPDIEP